MKTVIIARHAKSGWDNPNLSDFERTLNHRGLRDAPFMAEKIKELVAVPELIITSGATRARTTTDFFVKAFDYPESKLIKDDRLYDGGPKYILKRLKELDDKINSVAIFAHNPDITYVATFLAGQRFDNIPTCGIVCLEFDIEKWAQIDEDNGELKFFEYPKKYLGSE